MTHFATQLTDFDPVCTCNKVEFDTFDCVNSWQSQSCLTQLCCIGATVTMIIIVTKIALNTNRRPFRRVHTVDNGKRISYELLRCTTGHCSFSPKTLHALDQLRYQIWFCVQTEWTYVGYWLSGKLAICYVTWTMGWSSTNNNILSVPLPHFPLQYWTSVVPMPIRGHLLLKWILIKTWSHICGVQDDQQFTMSKVHTDPEIWSKSAQNFCSYLSAAQTNATEGKQHWYILLKSKYSKCQIGFLWNFAFAVQFLLSASMTSDQDTGQKCLSDPKVLHMHIQALYQGTAYMSEVVIFLSLVRYFHTSLHH